MAEKVLFFDVDGTLVDSYNGIPDIPEGVKNELKRIQGLGHKIFVCSGRPKAMMDDRFDDFDGYVLANGGYVEIDGKSIFENRMDYKLSKEVVDVLKSIDSAYMLETATEIYCDYASQELYDYFNRGTLHLDFIREFDEDEVLHRTIKIEMNVTNANRDLVIGAIEKHFGFVLTYDMHGSENAFEIYSPTLSKAIGMQHVLDYYGVSKEDTYGFGDGTNDIEMIKFAGVGVAMGNAVDSLKEVADIVCEPIQQQGLEKILKELF